MFNFILTLILIVIMILSLIDDIRSNTQNSTDSDCDELRKDQDGIKLEFKWNQNCIFPHYFSKRNSNCKLISKSKCNTNNNIDVYVIN